MRLSELLEIAGIKGAPDSGPEITGVQSDSRLVTPGSLFVAVKGTEVDGHDYIGKAIEQGAVAIVCEHSPLSTQQTLHSPLLLRCLIRRML